LVGGRNARTKTEKKTISGKTESEKQGVRVVRARGDRGFQCTMQRKKITLKGKKGGGGGEPLHRPKWSRSGVCVAGHAIAVIKWGRVEGGRLSGIKLWGEGLSKGQVLGRIGKVAFWVRNKREE